MKTLIAPPAVHLLASAFYAEDCPNAIEYRSAPADAYMIIAGETGLGKDQQNDPFPFEWYAGTHGIV